MEKYPQGLNYVPLLKQNISPPSSGRSRISITKRGSQRSLICYNGNYEGDITMFKEKRLTLEQLDLLDTDSDTEYKKDLQQYVSTISIVSKPAESLLWRLFQLFMIRFLSQEKRLKITQLAEEIMDSPLYNRFLVCTKYITVMCVWLFHFLAMCAIKINVLSNGFWKSRSIFRNLARRILWWMTLAKCGDLPFFALILFGIPWLFAIATTGFIISLYCSIKESLQRLTISIKTHMI